MEPSECHQVRNCWNKRAATIPSLFLSLSLPALAHERVRKVRSVQKSRGVIYHLQMIASRAVKAIRFNTCIHAAAKSLSRISFAFFFFFFFFLAYARPTQCTCSTSIARDHQCPVNRLGSLL